MKYLLFSLGLVSLLLACTGSGSSTDTDANILSASEARDLGRKVSALAGAALVSQLGQALANQDAAYAIQFCNIEASAIVDSINRANDCTVQRITSRNRNPANRLETDQDRIAWIYFKTRASGKSVPDTVLVERGTTPVYYQPIFIASEMCLQCHGSRSMDIELATLEKISSLYPADAAVNYVLGDLRGMWKISFERSEE